MKMKKMYKKLVSAAIVATMLMSSMTVFANPRPTAEDKTVVSINYTAETRVINGVETEVIKGSKEASLSLPTRYCSASDGEFLTDTDTIFVECNGDAAKAKIKSVTTSDAKLVRIDDYVNYTNQFTTNKNNKPTTAHQVYHAVHVSFVGNKNKTAKITIKLTDGSKAVVKYKMKKYTNPISSIKLGSKTISSGKFAKKNFYVGSTFSKTAKFPTLKVKAKSGWTVSEIQVKGSDKGYRDVFDHVFRAGQKTATVVLNEIHKKKHYEVAVTMKKGGATQTIYYYIGAQKAND